VRIGVLATLTFASVAAVTDDGRWIAWGGRHGQIGLLADTKEQHQVMKLARGPDDVALIDTVVFLPRAAILVWEFVGMERTQLLAVDSFTVIEEYETGGSSCVAVSPDGRWLALGSLAPNITVWDRERGSRVACFAAHNESVGGVAFHPTTSLLATCGHWGGGFKVWDIADLAHPRRVLEDAATVNDLKFLPDGRLITGGESGDLSLWDVGSRRLVARASTAELGGLKLVEEDDQVTITHDKPEISKVAVSPNGRTVAAGTVGGAVVFYEVT
jgi:WD40 repeat protein